MKQFNTYLSINAPAVREGLWLKPVENGFTIYLIDCGTPKPLKIVQEDDVNEKIAEDVAAKIVGNTKDKKTADTINGAKALAKDLYKLIIGLKSDSADALTLNGLKNYIDKKLK